MEEERIESQEVPRQENVARQEAPPATRSNKSLSFVTLYPTDYLGG